MWKIGIQLTLPPDYQTNDTWSNQLQFLKKCRIDHLELNVLNPEKIDTHQFIRYFEKYNLKIKKIATGVTAKAERLSLSSPNKNIREKTIQRCRQFITFASETGADVIFGCIKGLENIPKHQSCIYFSRSLTEISDQLAITNVKVYVEAINRYETTTVNTIGEGFNVIQTLDFPGGFRVLPDTYHMNIEEDNYFIPFVKYTGMIDTIHLSDSNRFFPGLGSFDFVTFFKFLEAIDYSGTLTIEGKVRESIEKDVKRSMNFMMSLF